MSGLNLVEVGELVRRRREALGLSQQRLAKLADLSRATINQLETGTLVDLGVRKLANLLNLLGLHLEAGHRDVPRRGLRMASRTASVSCKTQLDPKALARALASGDLPAQWVPHVCTLIDEAPLPILVSAVEEAAQSHGVPAKRVWQHLARWASELRSPRSVWA
jgi:transcriptional regulator with XRE-family HTH domain